MILHYIYGDILLLYIYNIIGKLILLLFESRNFPKYDFEHPGGGYQKPGPQYCDRAQIGSLFCYETKIIVNQSIFLNLKIINQSKSNNSGGSNENDCHTSGSKNLNSSLVVHL